MPLIEDFPLDEMEATIRQLKEENLAYKSMVENVYPNFTSPRGLALIINNYYFPRIKNKYRQGSPADVVNMNNLLKQLDYQVTIQEDLKAAGIVDAVAEFAKRPDHWRLDSAIVVVMSHGLKDTILGVDQKGVDVNDLIGLLIKEAPGLRGKPKIFILQACRGGQRDDGVPRFRRPDECDGTTSAAVPSTSSDINGGQVPSTSSTVPSTSIVIEPTYADVLIAYPTTPHYVSFRNTRKGSCFVQIICEVFSRYAKEEDIESMLIRVRRAVAKRKFDEKGYKQMPQTSTTLRKKFYFKQMPQTQHTLRKKFYIFPGVQQSEQSQHQICVMNISGNGKNEGAMICQSNILSPVFNNPGNIEIGGQQNAMTKIPATPCTPQLDGKNSDEIERLIVKGIPNWTPEEVAKWVNHITNSDANGERFVQQEIDGISLVLLSCEQLQNELKLKLGLAVKLNNALKALKAKSYMG